MNRIIILVLVLVGLTENLFPGSPDEYRANCRNRDMEGCYQLGLAYARGEGIGKNIKIARSYLQLSCDEGLGDACVALQSLTVEDGANKTRDKQDNSAESACLAGDAKGCYRVAVTYRDGLGVKQDTEAAKSYFKMACDQGDTQSCVEMNAINQTHSDSGTTMPETKEENKFTEYREACDNNDGSACYELGLLYDEGKMVAKNEKKADQFILRACELKYDVGCLATAAYYQVNNNMKKAIGYYVEVCERGDASACALAAVLYQYGYDNLDKDIDMARKYYKKACDLGDMDGCAEYRKIRK